MGLRDVFRRKDDDHTAQMMREAAAARPAQPTAQVPPSSLNGTEFTGSGRSSGGFTGSGKPAAARERGEVQASGFSGGRTATDDDVRDLARNGQLVDAIKLYRELHGIDLKGAKQAVDGMAAGGAIAPNPTSARGNHDPADDAVRALARDGQLIEAIKLYRFVHGVGLKEAKDAVDGMRGQ